MLSRAFNTITIDPTKSFLTKSSKNRQKIKDEVEYYLKLPKSINNFFPELLDYAGDYSKYTLKYYPYDNLANIFLNSQMSFIESKEIINRLLEMNAYFQQLSDQDFNKNEVINFYINKSLKRIAQINEFPELKTSWTLNFYILMVRNMKILIL